MNTADPELAKQENRRKALEALAHLDALDADPHFAWFVTSVLEKKRDEERDDALSTTRKPEEAERARWRHDLARKLCEEPKRLRAMFEQQAKPSA